MEAMTATIRVLKLTRNSLNKNAKELVRRTGLWHFVYILVGLISTYLFGLVGIKNYANLMLLGLATWLLLFLVWCVIAIKTHRVLIPKVSSAGAKQADSTRAPYLPFIVRVIFLGLLFALLCAPSFFALDTFYVEGGNTILGLSLFAFTILGLWFFSGLSMSLPSIAVEQPMTIGAAYELTRGYRFLMFVMAGLFPFIFWLSDFFLGSVIQSQLIYSIVQTVIELALTVLEIGFLSMCYLLIMGEKARP